MGRIFSAILSQWEGDLEELLCTWVRGAEFEQVRAEVHNLTSHVKNYPSAQCHAAFPPSFLQNVSSRKITAKTVILLLHL